MAGGPGPAGGPCWRRRPGVLERRGPFGVALWALDADEPVVLAGTGPAVWEALAAGGTTDGLAATLAAAFGADPARVAADIAVTLEALARAGVAEATERTETAEPAGGSRP